MRAHDDPEAAAVFEFLDDYLADLEAGRVRTLAEYLQRHGGHDAAIAREFLALSSGATEHEPHPSASASSRPGQDLDERRLGPYRLLRELGRGGQGSVWLAEDVRLARRVAVKVLASRFETVSDDRRRRFRREAEVIARLEHPSICPIFDADIDGETPWIAMRYVEGRTLAQVLAEARQTPESGGPPARPPDDSLASDVTSSWPPRTTLDVQRTLLFFERTARALHAAHEAGVIHRDVKPGNLIMTPDGKPVVLDFGLAREVESQGDITESGEVFGTPAYMSPEQLRGASDELDRRTDVYSLGVTLYEALTLKRPFEAGGKRSALQAALQDEPVADPRALNPLLSYDVKVVLETALEKDRARRYATALELAEDLRRIREYEPIKARPASLGLRFARWTRRHPALAVSTIGTIVVLAAGLTVTSLLNVELKETVARKDEAIVAKNAALSVALGKHLAQRCETLVREDPACALELGIQAVQLAPSAQARQALFTALEASHLKFVLDPNKADLVWDQALSPDGSEIALACRDGTLHVFETQSGARRATLGAKDPHAALLSVVWARDGQTLWIATSDEGPEAGSGPAPARVERWERSSGRRLASSVVSGRPGALQLDAANSALVARLHDGSVVSFDPDSLEVRRSIPALDTDSADFAVLLDQGATIVTAGRSRAEILFWDTQGTAEPRRLAFANPVTALSPLPGSARVAVGTAGGVLQLFEHDGSHAQRLEFEADASVELVQCSSDGSWLALLLSSAGQRRAALVDVEQLRVWPLRIEDAAQPRALALSPSAEYLALGCSDFTLRILPVPTRAPEWARPRSIAVGFSSPDGILWSDEGSTLFTRPRGQFVQAWHAALLPEVPSVSLGPDLLDARLQADGRRLSASSAQRGLVSIELECDTREAVSEDLVPARGPRRWSAPVYSAAGEACAVGTSSPDPTQPWTWVVQGSSAGRWTVEVQGGASWSGVPAGSGEALALIDERGRGRIETRAGTRWRTAAQVVCTTATFDATNRMVAFGSADGRIHVHEAHDGRALAVLAAPQPEFDLMIKGDGVTERRAVPADDARKPVVHVAFRPETNELASFHQDMRVRLWDAGSGALLHTFPVLFPPRSLSFSRDGALLLVSGANGGGAVRVFDVATKKALTYDTHHTRPLSAAEFSPDGRYVLTASHDGTIFVRESRPADEPMFVRRVFAGLEVVGAHFDARPGELRVVSSTSDGVVRVWPVDPLPAAQRRVRYDMSDWEIKRERKAAFPLEYRPPPGP